MEREKREAFRFLLYRIVQNDAEEEFLIDSAIDPMSMDSPLRILKSRLKGDLLSGTGASIPALIPGSVQASDLGQNRKPTDIFCKVMYTGIGTVWKQTEFPN